MWCLIFSGIFLSIQTFLSFSTVITDIKEIKFKIFDWLLFVVYHKLGRGQHSGWFAGQAVTTATLNIIIFVAMGLFLTEKSKLKIWFLRIVIVMTIFFFLFISTKLRKNFLKNSLIVISMILLILLSTKYISKHKTPRAVQVSAAKGSSLALRLKYWNEGFYQVSKRSLTLSGLGIGGYTAVNRMAILHPHNLYFHLLFDFGFIGIIFICAVILILARIFLKIVNYQETYLQNMSIAFASAFICIGISGVVSFTYYLSMLWLLLALGSSTFYMTQKELFEEKQITNAALHGMACGHSEVIGALGSKVVSQQL
jgi:O-antigen ligase